MWSTRRCVAPLCSAVGCAADGLHTLVTILEEALFAQPVFRARQAHTLMFTAEERKEYGFGTFEEDLKVTNDELA